MDLYIVLQHHTKLYDQIKDTPQPHRLEIKVAIYYIRNITLKLFSSTTYYFHAHSTKKS